jgi:hypothetical protein
MTPRERAEALFRLLDQQRGLSHDEYVALISITEHVCALLADDEAAIEAMANAIYDLDRIGERDWMDAPASVREDCLACARAALAALRRKALGE